MELQLTKQLDYLQKTLSIFLTNPSDITEQFESLIDELIKENKQTQLSPKTSPASSDSRTDLTTTNNSPQPQTKKRSAPIAVNSKPPPSKRLRSNLNDKDDDVESNKKQKKNSNDTKSTSTDEDDETNDDDHDESKTKSSESQSNPSSSRDMDEFAIELGLVCTKCKVLTEEKDNRLVDCHECNAKYHQKCHKPPVITADISDPRCLWYCSKCRRSIMKRQQNQSSIKETKTNSNPSSSSSSSLTTTTTTTKSKPTETNLSSTKKSLTNSISNVSTGLFSFKAKSSDSITSDNNSNNHSSVSSSNTSIGNNTTKNANGWASLATGFKEKKATETTTSSSTSILSELTSLSSTSNNNANETKRSPPSITTKQTPNGNNVGLTKSSTSSLSATSIKSIKPSSPPVLTQLSSPSLKPTPKILPTAKTIQRISSPTPLGRQTSVVKSPPNTNSTNPIPNRLSNPGSFLPNSSSGTNTKIATGSDYEKRLKQMRKIAAEKSWTKKN